MRIVALPPDASGHIRAGLQIEPKPGWITYWREPGESGIRLRRGDLVHRLIDHGFVL